MKVRNFITTLFILVVSLTLVSVAYPQKSKKIRNNRKAIAKQTVSLTEEQKNYLEKLIEKLDSADTKYHFYTQGFPAYDFFEKVSEMLRTDDGDSVELPEPIQSQTSYVIRSYKGWKELLYLMTEKNKSLDYIQYQDQLKSILEDYSFDGISATSALTRLKSMAQNSKNKLKLMLSEPSKRISPDTFPERFPNGLPDNIILIPVPKKQPINKEKQF